VRPLEQPQVLDLLLLRGGRGLHAPDGGLERGRVAVGLEAFGETRHLLAQGLVVFLEAHP